MKLFKEIAFSIECCKKELEKFQCLLKSKDKLEETKDIRPFFSESIHLSALIGTYVPNISIGNLLAFEYPLYGDFICDLIVGNSKKNCFLLIEFEDAAQNSIFQSIKSKICCKIPLPVRRPSPSLSLVA